MNYVSFPFYWTRRQLLRFGVVGTLLPLTVSQLSSCHKRNLLTMKSSNADTGASEGRLLSRPKNPTATVTLGLHPLGLDGQRDGLVYVPKTYQPDRPAPLVLILHGAGGTAQGALKILRHLADPFEMIVLAVDSRQKTWDIIRGDFGGDIAFIDSALAQTFSRYAIDPNRVAIAGFWRWCFLRPECWHYQWRLVYPRHCLLTRIHGSSRTLRDTAPVHFSW